MVRWLARDEHAAAIASRIPAPPQILLTKGQMQGVFLVLVVLLPLSMVGAGRPGLVAAAMNAVIRRFWMPAVGAVALAYLVIMLAPAPCPNAGSSCMPRQTGVLRLAPESITRVTVVADGKPTAFVRQANGWVKEGSAAPADAQLAETIDRAVKFMHTANPVRMLEPEEVADTGPADFGLDSRACRSRSRTPAAPCWRPISATPTTTACSSTCA